MGAPTSGSGSSERAGRGGRARGTRGRLRQGKGRPATCPENVTPLASLYGARERCASGLYGVGERCASGLYGVGGFV